MPDKDLSQAELLENSGMGAVPDEESVDDKEQKTDPEVEEADSDDEADDESDEESEEDDSDDEDADDEEDDSDDEEGEEDEDPKSKSPARTVPYGLLKAKNATIKALKLALKNAGAAAEKRGDDAGVDEIAAMTDKLADELGAQDLDKERLGKILRAAVTLASKNRDLPDNVKEKLKKLDEFEKEMQAQKKSALEAAEVAHFNKEWGTLLEGISKQYPNATQAMLDEAKAYMDKVAHSKAFHDKELDYVLFKNKAKFDAILKAAPKGKSGEPGKTIVDQDYDKDGDDDDNIPNLEDLTPEIVKQREMKQTAGRMNTKDYKVQNPVR